MSNYILLVDDEEQILSILEMTIKSSYGGEILTATSGNKAIEVIKDKGSPVIVISDYRMPDGDGHYLYTYLCEHAAAVPFVICSGNAISELKEQFPKAYSIIEKPSIIGPLIDIVKEVISNPGRIPPYVPVRISFLMKFPVTICDYYLKLSETNYVLCYKSGVTLTLEDFAKLTAKKLDYCYITQVNVSLFIQACDKFLLTKSQNPISNEELVYQTFDSLEVIASLAKTLGWTDEFMESTKKTMVGALKILSTDISLSSLIKEKLNDSSSKYSKHVFLISVMGCHFCNYLGFSNNFAPMKISIAALLHDLNVPDYYYDNIQEWNKKASDKAFANDKNVQKYKNHTVEAANILRSLKNAPPDVDQIILQHHEKYDGSGFPRALTSSRISFLSSLFIMTEELTEYLMKDEDAKAAMGKYIEWGSEIYVNGEFKKIFVSLKNKVLGKS